MNRKIDARFETQLKGFKDEFKGEIRSEMHTLRSEIHGLFEQYFGSPVAVSSATAPSIDKGKGIMGSTPHTPPPGVLPRGARDIPQPSAGAHQPNPTSAAVTPTNPQRWGCPHFDGSDFKIWWPKLEQYFEAEGIADGDKVRTVMLSKEGKALDWHYHYAQKHGGLPMLEWSEYANALRERFGSSIFVKPMSELVTLKQLGTVEQYHEDFVSLLNQLNLSESYALCIFTSNLQLEISQYMELFEPKTIREAFTLARKVECILNTPPKKGLLSSSGSMTKYASPTTSSHNKTPWYLILEDNTLLAPQGFLVIIDETTSVLL